MSSKLEEFLMKLGQPGRGQVMASVFLVYCFMHSISLNYFISFITMVPSHHCKLPENWAKNMSIPLKNVSNDEVYASCHIYKDPFNQSLGTETCPNQEYEYDGDRDTAASEWGLVCERKYLLRVFQTMFFVGVMVGGGGIGFLADAYGRRKLWIVCVTGQAVLGVVTFFIYNFEAMCAMMLIRGLFIQGQTTTTSILMMELFPLKYRTKAGIVTLMMPALSLGYANLFAYFIHHWRYQVLIHSLSSIISMIGFWLVHESFRWMLANNRIQEAVSTSQSLAKFNRIHLPDSLEKDLKDIADEIRITLTTVKKQTVIDLMRHPFMRRTCCILCFNMFMAQICVYGFNFLINDIGGDVYLNFLIVSIADFMVRGSAYVLVERLGRTKSTAIALGTMGIMNLIFTISKSYQSDYANLLYLSLAVSLIGRAFNGMFFVCGVMQANEIFPTTVRSTANGILIATGRAGLLLLPVILLLGDYVWRQFPFLIFGIGSSLACLLSLLLPETQGVTLPNTIEEASRLRRRRNIVNGQTLKSKDPSLVVMFDEPNDNNENDQTSKEKTDTLGPDIVRALKDFKV